MDKGFFKSTAAVLRQGCIALSALALAYSCAQADETPRPLPPPQLDEPAPTVGSETAVLSGGCFWGMQGVFEHVRGVRRVVSGYSGGTRDAAHYDDVSNGDTGHAESVEIIFDPRQVSYGEILRVFFSVAHDPTELNRQGPDTGTNYRSDIFFANPGQERVARAYVAQLEQAHAFSGPIVTRLDPLTAFYAAEDYHQDYLIHHPDSPYIIVNDLPKIANLKRIYPALYRETPVMVSAR